MQRTGECTVYDKAAFRELFNAKQLSEKYDANPSSLRFKLKAQGHIRKVGCATRYPSPKAI